MRKIFVTAALCVASCFAHAQEQGGIVGTIRDQAGAVVSGAKVTVTNTETSQTRTVTTTSAGDFSTQP